LSPSGRTGVLRRRNGHTDRSESRIASFISTIHHRHIHATRSRKNELPWFRRKHATVFNRATAIVWTSQAVTNEAENDGTAADAIPSTLVAIVSIADAITIIGCVRTVVAATLAASRSLNFIRGDGNVSS
jgi:hypothetical protein